MTARVSAVVWSMDAVYHLELPQGTSSQDFPRGEEIAICMALEEKGTESEPSPSSFCYGFDLES